MTDSTINLLKQENINTDGSSIMGRPGSRVGFLEMTQVKNSIIIFTPVQCACIKVDEEKKVDAVEAFYDSVLGNHSAVQKLTFISESLLKF